MDKFLKGEGNFKQFILKVFRNEVRKFSVAIPITILLEWENH